MSLLLGQRIPASDTSGQTIHVHETDVKNVPCWSEEEIEAAKPDSDSSGDA